VRFVVSTRLGDPPTPETVRQWLDIDPEIEFKLDPTPEWTADLAETVAATDSVRVLDFKSYYDDEAVALLTEVFREMNGGELEREHRLVQSQLLDEFDVFQQEAEVTMSRDPLEHVEESEQNGRDNNG